MVILREDETLEHALLRFKNQNKPKIADFYGRMYYKSKSTKRRLKSEKNRRRRERKRGR